MIIYLLCVIIIWLFYIVIVSDKSLNKPPGPIPWPILGNLKLLRSLSKKFGGQHKAFLYLADKYKSNIFSLKLGKSNFYVVSGYDGVRKILKDDNFDGRPWNEFIKIRNMGLRKGITMNDGKEWKEMRGWLIRCLKNLGFGRVEMTDKINNELLIILDKLSSKNGDIIQMKSLIAPAVINVLWSVATGKGINDTNRLNYFMDLMVRRASAFDMAGGILSIFPWIRYFAPKKSGYEILVKLNNELREFLLESIDEHKKNYVEGKEMDLIDMFLKEMYTGQGPEAGFTEEQLLMILIDLFIAGLQTTTITLDFLFLYMTAHQDVQEKLQNELDLIVGDNQLPQLSHRQLLPFTEAVITESQRLRLVTPIIGPRRVLNNTIIDGYNIPKDSFVLINIYSVHSSSDNFSNPEKFEPERYIKNDVYVPDKKLILFGGGHRRCPGEILAKSSVFIIFTGIMKKYKLLPVSDKNLPDLEPIPGLTISPKPYDVLLVSRS
ncbi:hypothetical protein HCN44_001028 [Aphidius gifuensis]|uniref:Cytochrome P450 n=1 Tax=Aphidius gifuensis TaxID=684658 RepID=A0A834XK91_APHGI|nr:probable cytochrome P450 305a1 [Aphidius gifuensis]KAF7988455.1 hypothetical protein HCN44_001028 [Aphidius gifuensis]